MIGVWQWRNRYVLWVVSGRSLDHAAGPRTDWRCAVERGQWEVYGVGAGLVLRIEKVGVDGLPKGVVIVHHAVAAGLAVSNDTGQYQLQQLWDRVHTKACFSSQSWRTLKTIVPGYLPEDRIKCGHLGILQYLRDGI